MAESSDSNSAQTRYYAFGWVTPKFGEDVAVGNFFDTAKLPDRRSVRPHLIRMAREAGHDVEDGAEVMTASFFELPPIPKQPPEDKRTPLSWEIAFDYACDDVKFGSSACGIFGWPEEPQGAVLEAMTMVLISNQLAVRGTDPECAPYSRIIERTVKPSSKAPTFS
jgi:hypothetical protein